MDPKKEKCVCNGRDPSCSKICWHYRSHTVKRCKEAREKMSIHCRIRDPETGNFVNVKCVPYKARKTRMQQMLEQSQNKELERSLLTQIKMYGLPEGEEQFKAIKDRDFAFDRAWPEYKLLCEVQGGIFSSQYSTNPLKPKLMGHNSITGILRDHEKNNLAVENGWQVLYANAKTLRDGSFIQLLARILQKEKANSYEVKT